ncbi:MAG: tRNA (N(6)-L-threonylcarbamoyladenosine(37)-C(2))-methylthiotransferase MtaB [Mesoaciditoga sp.]|uniref:MiaB/RimO family radical SAM methylthiotransferase n=1 Tax=Athalassotoga sp. TaxID=2022597 RepID=UPI000CB1797B|nr:MAG: tRNA (N(6)-L-threonylcarbamoyladenosine(37)-C(2))-methylthiotransferase MtaB [Mesoaciditoga sp.]PMP80480.1 MAG: tRNA (N(6)-L-threonylcarbamoyladenosine(37)-C(2))-methylthiotransferase MtaB [Mesoaciditoga sp.]HEU23723.1 MiaB/RimO family radical SAM methylthiotransferase [Mesoaciditoga lauensis]
MKYHIYTLGCKFNLYESARISEILDRAGYQKSDPQDSDLIIINSCAVTSEAKRQSLQMARHFKRISQAKIVFTGCAVHDDKIEDFDLVLGNGEKMRILEFMDKDGKICDNAYFLNDDMNYEIEKIPERTRGFLSIENGCNWGCTYCAIPHFRGTKIRSKPVNTVVEEAIRMVRSGIKEIVISGINIALYNDNGLDLGRILDLISKIDGDFRIRIGSIDPVNAIKIAWVFSENQKMCHHIHLSLQSGSDKVLKDMGRPYRAEDAIRLAEKMREIDRFFAFSADVICGFPTENENDFFETVKLLKEIGVMRIHAFPFSPRRGTRATSLKNSIDGKEKKRRVNILRSLSNELEHDLRRKIKSKQKILVEEKSGNLCSGFSDYYLKYTFKDSESKIGDFVEIEEGDVFEDIS